MTDERPLRVHRVLHEAAVGPIAYPQAKVIVVTAGWTNLVLRKQVTSLREGDVAILPARALVSGAPIPIAETVTFYLDVGFLQQQLRWMNMSDPVSTAFDAAAEGAGLISLLRPSTIERRTLISQARMLAACDMGTEAAGWGLLAECLRLLSAFDRVVSPTPGDLPRSEARAAVAALRGDLARRWTVTDLSGRVNLSASQLTRVFNAAFGVSPMRVLTRLRAEKLAELLHTTDWSVQRCSEAVGWPDASHATRTMKHIYGITPTQYRTAARKRSHV